MLLAVDVGNTNTVFALVRDGEAIAQWRTATAPQRTADEYAVWLSQLMAMGGQGALTDLSACIVSTVVPQALFNLRNLARRYLNCEPMIVGPDIPGIEVRIERPSEAGADRLVGAVGGFVAYGGPLIIVDSGTATTFDVVGTDGAFEGGVIAPGINLSVQALHTAAARLPRIEIARPDRTIGTGTVEAMQSGVFWGYVGLIEGLIGRIKAEYGRPMTVVATGGVSSLFRGATDAIDHFDPDLTIRGLTEIARRLAPDE
ncbi:type III pantothenate kinase [Parvularcula dongshanensis]|uniref:Type III pantothenate kinase n=2 Tax=Parvularcula dongshanensis TaxID=1173995 RepID=A0A840I4Q5_9PROT|nr:type III pantothenate kinase [Parvularcula dongshanensis]MBB4659767.1 type III pantothenate kinase [Parvularcula dongshanensis]